jgi:DUF4097 and DUF4098 domain-containing protein YvlB
MRTLIAAIGTTFVLLSGNNGTLEKHREIEKHYPTQTSQRIEINGFMGSDIRFISWDKNEVYVKLDISISSSDESYESRYIESASITDSQTAEALVVRFREPERFSGEGRSFWGAVKSIFSGSFMRKEISGEIYVPRSNALSTDMRYGSISLENMKGALRLLGTSNTLSLKNCSAVQEIENDYGETSLEQCGGNLNLSTKSSKVLIEQFDGKVSVDADYSTITVRDVQQPVAINSTSATITVENVQGSATIHSNYSTITANSIAGLLDIQTKSGKIRARSLDGLAVDADYTTVEVSDVSGKASKEIIVSGRSGSLHLEDAVGNLKVTDPYSNVDLRNIRGNVDVSSTSSRVTAEEIVGDWRSSTEYSSVTLRGLSAQRVWMLNKSNPIDVQLKTVPANIEIKNEYASVTVSMPTGFSGDVDLNVTYGNIETNLPLDRKKSFGGSGGYAFGKVGTGTGKINIETTSGNIKLMQR